MVDKRLLIYLVIGFIVATVIGTLSHEGGHYLVAKSLGFDASINYRSTSYSTNAASLLKTPEERFLFTLGGPVQTMLTGTIGLLLLYRFRRSFNASVYLNFRQWVLIFLSLFWLRQLAILVAWVMIYFVTGRRSSELDEIKISRYFGLQGGVILILTGLIGLAVLLITIFRFIPQSQRSSFMISGFLGAIAGYLLWFEWLGKIIMP